MWPTGSQSESQIFINKLSVCVTNLKTAVQAITALVCPSLWTDGTNGIQGTGDEIKEKF